MRKLWTLFRGLPPIKCAEAAKELDALRNNWLNPPEWTRTEILEFPGSTTGPWRRYISPLPPGEGLGEGALKSTRDRPSRDDAKNPHPGPLPEGEGVRIGTVRYPRIVPKDEECAKQLKKRTLTNLYNERPTWLDLAHQKLDAAVFAAYGWDPAVSDDDLLAALLARNLERAAAQ